MADTLDFQFNLFDKVTGPVDAMVHSLDRVNAAMKATEGAMGKVNAQAKKDFFTFDLATTMRAGVDMAGAMIGKTIDLGKAMLNSAAGAESLRNSFEAIAGKEGAQAIMEDVAKVAQASAFDDDALMAAVRPMVQAGVRGDDLKNALVTALESESQRGGGIGQVQGALDAMLKIRQTGSVNARTLESFGVKAADVWGIVGKNFNISAKAAEKKAEAGKIGSDNLAAALQQALAAKSGGVLGGGAAKRADELESKMRKLSELPDQFFKKMANTEAFEKIKGAIDRILVALDPNSANGKKIQAFLVGVFEKMANAANDIPGIVEYITQKFDSLVSTLSKVITAVEVIGVVWAGITIVNGITALVAILPALATGMGTVVAIFSAVLIPVLPFVAALTGIYLAVTRINDAVKELGGLARVFDDLKEFISGDGPAVSKGNPNFKGFGTSRAAAMKAGADVSAGFSEGMANASVEVSGAALGQSAADGLTSSLDIRSPSRVFAQLGAMTSAGFAEGVAGGSGMTQGALGQMAAAPKLGGGGNQFSVSITVNTGGGADDDTGGGASIAQHLADLMPSMLEDAMEKLALEMGGVA